MYIFVCVCVSIVLIHLICQIKKQLDSITVACKARIRNTCNTAVFEMCFQSKQILAGAVAAIRSLPAQHIYHGQVTFLAHICDIGCTFGLLRSAAFQLLDLHVTHM